MCDGVSDSELNRLFEGAAQHSLAANGAIACFSSSIVPFSLNADRAPQLKASVGLLRENPALRRDRG